jgi:hypothetical protein
MPLEYICAFYLVYNLYLNVKESKTKEWNELKLYYVVASFFIL